MPEKQPATDHHKPQVGFIYVITNMANGMRYIGQTTRPLETRWKQHRQERRNTRTIIQRAIQKYGIGRFEITPLARVVAADPRYWLNLLEPAYIAAYQTLQPHGYNLDSGGRNSKRHPTTNAKISASLKGHPVSEETRAKIGAIAKGNQYCKGRPVPQESRERIRAGLIGNKALSQAMQGNTNGRGNKGKVKSAETIAKISAGRRAHPPTRVNYKHSAETKAKMKAGHQRRRLQREQGIGAHSSTQRTLPFEDD